MEIDGLLSWFKNWTKLKIKIHLNERIIYFREREIWWTSLGANIGFEQNGKNEAFERPVLILKKFGKEVLWAIPLTSKNKSGFFYYDLSSAGFNSRVILSQLKLISSKRLIRKIGIIPTRLFLDIRLKLKALI